MTKKPNTFLIDTYAVETEARKLRADWISSLFTRRKR